MTTPEPRYSETGPDRDPFADLFGNNNKNQGPLNGNIPYLNPRIEVSDMSKLENFVRANMGNSKSDDQPMQILLREANSLVGINANTYDDADTDTDADDGTNPVTGEDYMNLSSLTPQQLSEIPASVWVPDRALQSIMIEKNLHPDESAPQTAARLIQDNAPMAALGVIHAARYARDPKLRFAAQNSILDRVFGKAGASGIASDSSAGDVLNNQLSSAVDDLIAAIQNGK